MPVPDSPTVSGLPAEKLMAAGLGNTPVSSPAFAWVPPPVEEVAPWFPDYEIQSLAGRGAMGAVYRAVQKKLERPVAIKLLPAELAARDGVTVRFEREARALAQLNHPGIVALHDFGRTATGHLFIVMEYVDGTDLSRLLHAEGGALGVPQALEIVSQVCDALQYAHNHGFVHRDIKPGNVLVDREGRVKIADFGLAKFIAGDRAAQQNSLEGRATFTGLAVGTPDYTAPEQLKGGPVDHRADIYSLGVMFYEMLTGDLPRGAWTPPSQRTAAPVRLDEVVNRALQSEPDRRYQQASEVKAAVAGVPEKRPRASLPGIVWLPLGMLTAGIVLLSLNRQSVIPGVLLIMLAAVVWLYQQSQPRWMAVGVIGGLALWPFLKDGKIDGIPPSPANLCMMVLVPFAALASFRHTRRAAWGFVIAIAAFLLAGGLTTLGLSNHPKATAFSSANPSSATPAAIAKMQEACSYYDRCLHLLSSAMASKKKLKPVEMEARDRDAIRIEGMMREALALGMDGSHPLAVEARSKFDELMRQEKVWRASPADLPFAEARAQTLTSAIAQFVSANGKPNAIAHWENKTPEQRYGLIKVYVDYAPATLEEYTSDGFQFVLPDKIDGPAKVTLVSTTGIPIPGERAIADLNQLIDDLANAQRDIEESQESGCTRYWLESEEKEQEKTLKTLETKLKRRAEVGFAPGDSRLAEASRRLDLLQKTHASMRIPDGGDGVFLTTQPRGGYGPHDLFPQKTDLIPGVRVAGWKGVHPCDRSAYYVEQLAGVPADPKSPQDTPLEEYPECWPLNVPLARPSLPAACPQSQAELEWITKQWPAETATNAGLVLADLRSAHDNHLGLRFLSRSSPDPIPWAEGEPRPSGKATDNNGYRVRIILKGGKCYTDFSDSPMPQLFGAGYRETILWAAWLIWHRQVPLGAAALAVKRDSEEEMTLPQMNARQTYLDMMQTTEAAKLAPEAAEIGAAWSSWQMEKRYLRSFMNLGLTEKYIPIHQWRGGRLFCPHIVCSREMAEKFASACGARLPVVSSQAELEQLTAMAEEGRPVHLGLVPGDPMGDMHFIPPDNSGHWVTRSGEDAVVKPGERLTSIGRDRTAYVHNNLTRALLVLEWPAKKPQTSDAKSPAPAPQDRSASQP